MEKVTNNSAYVIRNDYLFILDSSDGVMDFWRLIVIFAGSDKFNERELETFIKKKERELILLHVHVVLIYYFYLGFNQSLRYNFICMSSFPTGMTGHLYKRCL